MVELSAPPAYIAVAIGLFSTAKVGLTIILVAQVAVGVIGYLTERSGLRVILTDGAGVFFCDYVMFLVSRPTVSAIYDASDY